MSMSYQLGLCKGFLVGLTAAQKFDALKQFCKAHNIPELCEVIDDQVHMFCYDENGNIISIPYDEYFGGGSSYILTNHHQWHGSVSYGLDFFGNMQGDIIIPYCQSAETKIDLHHTPLDGLFFSGLDYYLFPQAKENIERMEELYPLYSESCTKDEYLEINLSIARVCSIAENYRMCICWSY
jgi:hypothetical protein